MTDAMRSRIAEIDAAVEALRAQRLLILERIRWIEAQTPATSRHSTPKQGTPDAAT